MMTSPVHICITKPQWINFMAIDDTIKHLVNIGSDNGVMPSYTPSHYLKSPDAPSWGQFHWPFTKQVFLAPVFIHVAEICIYLSKNLLPLGQLFSPINSWKRMGCVLRTVATVDLMLKTQTNSIHSTEDTFIAVGQFQTKIFHLSWTAFVN